MADLQTATWFSSLLLALLSDSTHTAGSSHTTTLCSFIQIRHESSLLAGRLQTRAKIAVPSRAAPQSLSTLDNRFLFWKVFLGGLELVSAASIHTQPFWGKLTLERCQSPLTPGQRGDVISAVGSQEVFYRLLWNLNMSFVSA